MTLDGSWMVLLGIAIIQIALLSALRNMGNRMRFCRARIERAQSKRTGR
jgi:hypothetical protein